LGSSLGGEDFGGEEGLQHAQKLVGSSLGGEDFGGEEGLQHAQKLVGSSLGGKNFGGEDCDGQVTSSVLRSWKKVPENRDTTST